MGLFKRKDKQKKAKKRSLLFIVTNGGISERLNDRGKMINMKFGLKQGIVTINKRDFYLLGITDDTIENMSVAKSMTGAAVGTIIAPFIGTLIGGAIGARKKKKTKFTFALREVSSDKDFVLEGEFKEMEMYLLNELTLHPKSQEVKQELKDVSSAGEIREYKSLLDDGIITAEEFERKKQALLK